MSRALTPTEQNPLQTKNGDWFYVGLKECTFHNNHTQDHYIKVQTKMLVAALRRMEREFRKQKAGK